MQHNHQNGERQDTQTKKTRINDEIANKKAHQQERRPNAKKKPNNTRKTTKTFFFPVFWPGIRTSENLENNLFKMSTEIQLGRERETLVFLVKNSKT